METIVNPEYLLSKTAIRVWKTNDAEGQNKMFVCITDCYKEKWFRGVLYKSSIIPVYQLQDIAEDAFLDAWENFNSRGEAGKIDFKEPEYGPYLYTIFQRTFLKLLKSEIRKKEVNKEYNRRHNNISENTPDVNYEKVIQQKIQTTFSRLNAEDALIIQWRYLHKLNYDAIAKQLHILRKSCVQKLYRAKQDFIKKWNSDT